MVQLLDDGTRMDAGGEQTVLDRLVRMIVATSSATMISVSLLDPETDELVVRASCQADGFSRRPAHLKIGENLEGWVAEHAAPLAFDNVLASSHPLARLAPAQVRSLVVLPLLCRQQVRGTLLLGSDEPCAFDDDAVTLAQTFADQTAAALGSFFHTATARRDLENAKRLLDASELLSGALGAGHLGETLAASVRQTITCDDFFVYEYDAAAAMLRLLASASAHVSAGANADDGRPAAASTSVSIGDQHALAAWVMRNERMHGITPRSRRTMRLTAPAWPFGRGYLLGVPLRVGERVLGALVLARVSPFNQGEQETARRLGALIGGALENAGRYRAALAQQRELTAAIAAAPEAIALIGQDRRVLLANDAFAASMGVAQAETLGADACELFHGYVPGKCGMCQGTCHIRQVLETRKAVEHAECEVIMRGEGASGTSGISSTSGAASANRLSGGHASSRIMEFSLTPMEGAHGESVLLLGHDVTEAHELEQTQKSFFSMISHELNTPLTIISSHLDLVLLGMAGDLTADQQQFLRRARASSEHLSTLVDDLLLISRREAGKFTLHPGEADMAVLIRDAVIDMQLFAEEADVQLRAELPESLPVTNADVHRMTQVVRNLLTNAVKFTPPQGEVTVTASRVDDQVVMRVRDTGVGIAQQDLHRIFDRFVQVHNAPTGGRLKGQGLGLAIVRIIVEGHGGQVSVESTPGEGSTFTVTLPVHPPAQGGD